MNVKRSQPPWTPASVGARGPWRRLVQNGVTHFWNWHRRMFEAGDYLPVREAAAFCYQTLIAMVDLRGACLAMGSQPQGCVGTGF